MDIFKDVLHISGPSLVWEEVSAFMFKVSVKPDEDLVRDAYGYICDMFDGQLLEYKECNTKYHDLGHTLNVFLATARLLDGALKSGVEIKPQDATAGLVASLFHDCGYIQDRSEKDGTGAKYTLTHVKRSVKMFEDYLARVKRPDLSSCGEKAILCTDLGVDIDQMDFESASQEIVGKLVGSADIMSQIADRIYLEKLRELYKEFDEAGVGEFKDEYEMFQGTTDFYEMLLKRLDDELAGVWNYSKEHFHSRWRLDFDPYDHYARKNMVYLRSVLADMGKDYQEGLRRTISS